MADKARDLKPDIVLKNYWSDNERFADMFNAVLFDGRQVIRPADLEDTDGEESSVLTHRNFAESIKASRDIIKVSRKAFAHGVQLVMLGMESQEHVHYAMPMRVMGYDYGAYRKQYERNAKRYRSSESMEEDEYLSRMKKADKFMPVITLTVYYGEKPWDGAVSLHGMLNIPEELRVFVNDYKMLLVEAGRNNLTFHNTDNEDFFNLLKILSDESRPVYEIRDKAIKYAREHDVDRDVIMTVAGTANCRIDYRALNGEGDAAMYTVFEEIARENEEKGKTQGKAEEIVETGYEFGLSEEDILERLQRKLKISLQAAQEYLNRFGKRTV